MQKIKIILLLPALFIFPYIMNMDPQTQLAGSDSFKSFEEKPVTPDDITRLIRPYAEGTSSGSGDDDKPLKKEYPAPLKPWHWTNADVFFLPDSPEPQRSKKPSVPPLNLDTTQRSLELKKQDRREQIKQNFGPSFVQQSEQEEKIGEAIALLQQKTPDSLRPRSSSSPQTPAPTTRKERVLSHETLMTKGQSKESILPSTQTPQTGEHVPLIASKTPEISLAQQPSSITTTSAPQTPSPIPTPPSSPRKTKTDIPQIPVAPPTTPSSQPASPASSGKTDTETPVQKAHSHKKNDDTKINNTAKETNPTSMRPLTWKVGGTALLTIAGLITLLYYLDPAAFTAKIDLILATLNMKR